LIHNLGGFKYSIIFDICGGKNEPIISIDEVGLETQQKIIKFQAFLCQTANPSLLSSITPSPAKIVLEHSKPILAPCVFFA
jgi:hypothetical protein